jgi:hypothetical protein
MSIVSLREYRQKSTVQLLEYLLDQARHERIDGIVFCIQIDHHRHAMGSTGAYAKHPLQAATVARLLEKRLFDQAEARRGHSVFGDLG